jgi:hypothetical protein
MAAGERVKATEGADSAPRSARQLVFAAFELYRRYPLLFLVLAAAVIVPYDAIVLLATGAGPLAQSSLGAGVGLLLTVTDLALVAPLVSALHVHAVAEVREGRDPKLGLVARQGLKVLPVVAAASIASWLGIVLGFFALIVPGVILTFRWFVVAQAAAIEHEGWAPALRRSAELTDGHYGHVFLLIVYIGLIVSLPTFLIGLGLGHDSTDAASFVVGVAVRVFAYSFGALVTALAYYDLRLRWESIPEQVVGGDGQPSPRNSWDPRDYSPEERPQGWYVDPERPGRMRFWNAGDPPDWGATTIRTPRKIRRAWGASPP